MAPRGKRISPEKAWDEIEWSAEEKSRDVAVRTLWKTSEASAHAVRLSTAEKPHVHDRHDMVIFVRSGKARVFLGGRYVMVGAGDVLEIPRGTVHWAQNLGPGAGEAYALYLPAYDGQDMRLVNPDDPTHDSRA
ncbi:MAG TPA: cupin domain-containing protein [Verrucomicrobiae bacterium]|nr:cupin domain-containing protein [Verrucomicrobiae bacterium]